MVKKMEFFYRKSYTLTSFVAMSRNDKNANIQLFYDQRKFLRFDSLTEAFQNFFLALMSTFLKL